MLRVPRNSILQQRMWVRFPFDIELNVLNQRVAGQVAEWPSHKTSCKRAASQGSLSVQLLSIVVVELDYQLRR